MNKEQLLNKIELLGESFLNVLYEDDTVFLENMRNNNLAGDDVNKYRYWEWTQGVGLYGFWRLFEYTNDKKYLNILIKYYDERFAEGLQNNNINTVGPMLTLAYLYEYTKEEKILPYCMEWAVWINKDLPKTKEGGFQHITSDTLNTGELWDDTLFMTVLFLAKMGMILDNNIYKDEAVYQFLIHAKYLVDRKTGLWFHGWTFEGNHNFAEGLWGRGNCWITIAIPEIIEILSLENSVERYFVELLERQVEGLEKFQCSNGMWHTLLDDNTSYVETSATCGFAYGILKAIRLNKLDNRFADCALKALEPVLKNIDDKGIVHQVSYGTPMGRVNKNFYKEIPIEPMPYGQALAMLFLIELLKVND